jgi:hypothetical protein
MPIDQFLLIDVIIRGGSLALLCLLAGLLWFRHKSALAARLAVVTPTAFAAYAFALPEALVMVMFAPI